jgi:CubicO group peptidase (beta-lactamase class C family)
MHLTPMIAAGLMLVAAVPSHAQQSLPPPAPPNASPNNMPQGEMQPAAGSPSAQVQLDRAEVTAWLDGFMPYALQRGDVAGAVVIIVKDGEVFLQKGYGYANVAERIPVDPERTLFRPGSISKLFTWTAVMQLVEQGKLDLDRDVNAYLDFQIPERAGGPVTLRHIMTHTAGFEEQIKDLMGVDADAVASLDKLLKRWTPERIFPAGKTPAYSNYATALAGYVVARVAGQSFDDYIEQHIFKRLGMEHSSFRQPLPERLRPQMSKGKQLASGPDQPFEIVGPAPAGSLSTTGADMARFMIAHLDNGGDLLQPATAQQMHATALTVIPPLNRMLLGFYETNYNGRRVIAHGGDTQWFHSYLHLYMDDGVGLYVSLNSAGKEGAAGAIRAALFEQFSDRYLAGPTPDGMVSAEMAAAHAQLIAGRYDSSRRLDSSFFSFLNLLGAVQVLANADGTICVSVRNGLNGQVLKWREIAPYVWREVDGKELLAAEVAGGQVVRFSMNQVSPFTVFEPTPWWRSPAWLLPALSVAFAALLLTSVFWPVTAIVRRRYGASLGLLGRDLQAYRWIRIAAAAALVTMLVWGGTLATMISTFSLLSPRLDGWIWVLHLLALVVFAGAAIIAGWNAWVTVTGKRGWFSKTWSVLLTAACGVVLWVALVFHLIDFSVHY